MAILAKLKEAEDIFRNICVSNDMPKEDSDLVISQVEVAKEKTEKRERGRPVCVHGSRSSM